MTEATGGDRDLQAYLQRVAGYCLTGLTHEHVLFFFYGRGGNGKGVFLNTLHRALGAYGRAAGFGTFTASQNDRHPTDLAALAGSRMVLAQETCEGRVWDEQRIKALTSSDTITARFLFRDEFTYTPTFKLMISANKKPRIPTVDEGFRRRLHLVPFTCQPPEVDLHLEKKLEVTELPAILAWAIDGVIAWQAQGLQPPRCVVAATEEYFRDEDAVGRWLGDACVVGHGEAEAAELYLSWSDWCSKNNESVGTQKAFASALSNRGFSKRKNAKGNVAYQNVSLLGEFRVPVMEVKG